MPETLFTRMYSEIDDANDKGGYDITVASGEVRRGTVYLSTH